jgi:hypothetical protein
MLDLNGSWTRGVRHPDCHHRCERHGLGYHHDARVRAGASIPTGGLREWTHQTTKLIPIDADASVYQGNLGIELGGARGGTRQ